MKKENVKTKNPIIPLSKKPSKNAEFNLFAAVNALMLGVYIFEGIKSITVASEKDYNIVTLSLEVTCSILLAFLYTAMEFYKGLSTRAPKAYRVIREVFLLGSMMLFLFSLQKTLIDTLEDDSEFFLVMTNLVSLGAVFMALGMIQGLLKVSIFSKIALIAYFMLYMCLQAISRPEVKILQSCLNTLIPLIYLSLLVLIKWKSEKEKPSPLNISPPPSTSPSLVVEKDLDLGQFVEESIFSYDKRGNLELLNGFSFQSFEDGEAALPANIFKRIKGVSLVSEEKLSRKFSEKESSEENVSRDFQIEMKSESTRHLKEMNHIILNLDENTSPRSFLGDNLDIITKNLYLSTMRKEITEPKVLVYSGSMQNGEQSRNHFQIKVHVMPKAKYPLVIVIKDRAAEKFVDEYRACDFLRERMYDNLASEVNNVMDMAKKVMEACMQEIKSKKPGDQVKTLFVNSIQQVLTPLIVTVGDLLDFCSAKIHKLKFVYAPCDLVKIIEKTVRLFGFIAKVKKIEIKPIFPKDSSGSLFVNTDEKRLLQLLIKILANAVKFTKQGTINIVVVPSSSSFNISIEDSGEGMSNEELAELKEELKEYHTDSIKTLHTKTNRAHGLAIAQMLAFGLGPKFSKELSIKSVPERGTEVSFFIENKFILEETSQKAATTVQTTSSIFGSTTRYGRHNHTPVRPSRFKLNHESDSHEFSMIFEEISEGIEINNLIYEGLELGLSKRTSEISSTKYQAQASKSFDSKKTKLMTSDQISSYGNGNPLEF